MGAKRGASPKLVRKRNQSKFLEGILSGLRLEEPAGLIQGEGRRSVLQKDGQQELVASESCTSPSTAGAEGYVTLPSPCRTLEGIRQAGLPPTSSPRRGPTSSWCGAALVAELALSPCAK